MKYGKFKYSENLIYDTGNKTNLNTVKTGIVWIIIREET